MKNKNDEEKFKIIGENDNEKKLFQFLIDPELFNEHKTKILSKNNYDFIIQLIKKEEDENLVNFIDYLNQINIPIIKILINGYIEFDFKDENEEKIIYEIISKIMGIFFNKKLF